MKSAINLTVISGIMIAIFSQLNPYDFSHPKRVYIIHSENVGRVHFSKEHQS